MTPRWFELNGNRFFARTWGDPSKRPILMLHGFPEYSGSWSDLAAYLQDDFYCIAPDQRGYGQSWCPEGVENYKGGALAHDMACLIDQIGAPALVIGHDWGASVAYALAMLFPKSVEKLIILNGVHPIPFQRAMATGGPQSEASQYINLLRKPDAHHKLAADDCKMMFDLFSAKMDFSWLTETQRQAYQTEWTRPGRLNAMLDWYRASPLLVADPGKPLENLPEPDPAAYQVQCPHLLIWGMNDTALLPESRDGLNAFAADLTIKELTNADHWLHHQRPETIAGLINEWLAR